MTRPFYVQDHVCIGNTTGWMIYIRNGELQLELMKTIICSSDWMEIPFVVHYHLNFSAVSSKTMQQKTNVIAASVTRFNQYFFIEYSSASLCLCNCLRKYNACFCLLLEIVCWLQLVLEHLESVERTKWTNITHIYDFDQIKKRQMLEFEISRNGFFVRLPSLAGSHQRFACKWEKHI